MVDSVEKVLELRESLIQIRSQHNFIASTLLHKLLTEAAKIFQVQQVNIILREKSVGLRHKSLGNNGSVNLIGLGLTDSVLSHRRSLDRVEDTDMKMPGNKEFNKIIAIVSRRFKTNDEAVFVKGIQDREQHTEAIIVICEFERFNEDFTIRR